MASRYSASFVRSLCGERALQVRDLLADRVEHAPLLAQPRQPRLRIRAGAVAEQALEHDARVVLRRQRRVLALPADRVRVGAGEPGVAGACRLAGLDRQLERRQLRLLARLLREDLIHRDAGVEPGLARRRRDVGQEPRAGFRVRAARPSGRRNALQAAQHEHLLAKRRQRAQRRRELVGRAFGQRQVVLHDHAVGHVHDAEPVDRSGGRLLQRRERGHHAVEQRQRQHRAHAAQDGAPRYRLLRDDHCADLFLLVGLPRSSRARDRHAERRALDDAGDDRRPASNRPAPHRARSCGRRACRDSRGRGRSRRPAASR